MDHLVDARGLRCPLPLVRARQALSTLGPRDVLVVLADDPEAPIDIAALAADCGRVLSSSCDGGVWRLEVLPPEQ